ncbi:DUF4861 family protein [Fretibacter rubidus]|uniref:DUF4861 family protein n=1 Tax=Fretibacter rubidus TaxID=570162 RepID=UPI00352A8128
MRHSFVAIAGALALSACATVENTGDTVIGTAKVDLRVSTAPAPDRVYEPRSSVVVPDTHTIGDHIYPYEGIGWENEIIGYRLYLDERAVTDIFGKRLPGIILDKIDYRSKYHDLADWGLDVQHVGPSMGVGGLGLYRGDSLERFGKVGQLSADVLKETGAEVSFKITHRDVPLTNNNTGQVEATYSLKSGSPLTWVNVKSTLRNATLASGLVKSPDNKRFRNSNQVKKGEWRYIATWGDKLSDVKDGLGTVLFYRDGDARLMPSVNETFPIRFNTPNPTYAFAGVWVQGPMGITNEESFIAWVDSQQEELNK